MVRLVLDNSFLDQELLICGIVYHTHCLMFFGDLTFQALYIVIYVFDVRFIMYRTFVVIYAIIW